MALNDFDSTPLETVEGLGFVEATFLIENINTTYVKFRYAPSHEDDYPLQMSMRVDDEDNVRAVIHVPEGAKVDRLSLQVFTDGPDDNVSIVIEPALFKVQQRINTYAPTKKSRTNQKYTSHSYTSYELLCPTSCLVPVYELVGNHWRVCL